MSFFIKEDGTYEMWESAVVGAVVLPYKLILRSIMECSCIENMHNEHEKTVTTNEEPSVLDSVVRFMGGVGSVLVFFLSIVFIAFGIAFEINTRETYYDDNQDEYKTRNNRRRDNNCGNPPGGPNPPDTNCGNLPEMDEPLPPSEDSAAIAVYLQYFGYSCISSLLIFTVCVLVFISYAKSWHDQEMFLSKFGHIFPDDSSPCTITEVYLHSKENKTLYLKVDKTDTVAMSEEISRLDRIFRVEEWEAKKHDKVSSNETMMSIKAKSKKMGGSAELTKVTH
jgi:hypothetical protein